MIWFSSDHHFGHANIIKYASRPFDSVEAMDTELIRRWNEVVGERDTVYYLGDFTMGDRASRYFRCLRGKVYVLACDWHHDKRWIKSDNVLWTNVKGFDYRNPPDGFFEVTMLPPLYVLTSDSDEHPPISLCHYQKSVHRGAVA